MEIKNLLEPQVKEEIINRIKKLTPATQRKWGQMDVAQMLAHTQAPLKVAIGQHQLKGSFLIRWFGPLFKGILYNETPYKKNIATDKSFKIAGQREFEKERQQLLDTIEMFCEECLRKDRHPYFGKLTIEQWGKSAWKHLDHHLRQFGV